MRALVALGLWLALAPGVRADAVFPPPASCPPGSIPATGHMGPFCAPSTCTAPTDCAASSRSPGATFECAEAGLCIDTRHVFAGRGGRVDLPITLASCRVGADCPTGVPCAITTRCIASGSVPGNVPDAFLPRAVGRTAAGQTCGALGVVGVLVIALAASGLAARGRDRAAREVAVRSLLEAKGRVTEAALEDVAGDRETAGRALAPLAHRVRVEIDDDGLATYALDADEPALTRADRVRDRSES